MVDLPARIYRRCTTMDISPGRRPSLRSRLSSGPGHAPLASRAWPEIRGEMIGRQLHDVLVVGQHFPARGRQPGAAALDTTLDRFDERRSKALVHRVDEEPGAPIAHAHFPSRRG